MEVSDCRSRGWYADHPIAVAIVCLTVAVSVYNKRRRTEVAVVANPVYTSTVQVIGEVVETDNNNYSPIYSSTAIGSRRATDKRLSQYAILEAPIPLTHASISPINLPQDYEDVNNIDPSPYSGPVTSRKPTTS